MEARTRETPPRVAIVGGGLAGLAAAARLAEVGREVVVFDKGRGPGGRATSRRADPFAFDHGAQYFTAREPGFRRAVESWLHAGVVARWRGTIVALQRGVHSPVDSGTERFVGVPRMSALAGHLARGLDLRSGVRVAALGHGPRGWHLTAEDGADLGRFEQLLVTAPPAQAAALIGRESPLHRRVEQTRMAPTHAVLLGLAEPYAVDFDGAFCSESALGWIARDSSKPGRGGREAWVLHATSEWTEENLEEDRATLIDRLTAELERATGVRLPAVLHRDVHTWRYARPLEDDVEDGVERFLVCREQHLALAGDAYCGGRVEGAYSSGLEAARALASVEP